MSVHPLRPDTHRCLGGPLPHQLANGTRAHPKAEPQLPFLTYLYVNEHIRYYLIFLLAIPIFRAGHPRVTHQSATLGEKLSSPLTVRLACLRRAASVRSEPGSNSPSLLFQTALKARPDFQVCSLKNYSFKGIFSRRMNLIKPFLKALKDSLQFNSS